MKRVCIFCGSSAGRRPQYLSSAGTIAKRLAQAGYGIVYGGASIGTMGRIADAAMAAGTEVIGVIPQSLADREIAHQGLSALHLVGSMHERKARMVELSDAFVVLPGGLGTLDEAFEILTWAQLGFHAKPVVFVNTCGYYTKLLEFVEDCRNEQFVRRNDRELLQVVQEPDELVERLAASLVGL